MVTSHTSHSHRWHSRALIASQAATPHVAGDGKPSARDFFLTCARPPQVAPCRAHGDHRRCGVIVVANDRSARADGVPTQRIELMIDDLFSRFAV